ncbi:MAG: hypothetical protein M1816_003678 [Peltula sp. TS41687]|nr:MAG: hypothetical protein M1816_003678 [Peltula sp. TS41687]
MSTSDEATIAASGPVPDARSSFKKAVGGAGIFPRNGPDPTARSWGHSSSGVTFAGQHKLPKLPLPSLESSRERYLEALRPLQSTEKHNDTEAAVKNFIDGEGPILQAQLQEYDNTHTNYMEHFCGAALPVQEQARLEPETNSLLPDLTFSSRDDPNPSRNDQITRATALVRSTLTFAQAIHKDQLPPDEVRGSALDMHQYWWLFGVARVPGEDGGRIRHDPDSRHIIVLCRGQFFRLDVLDESMSQIISEEDLSQNLKSILDDAYSVPVHETSKTAIGLFTTENQKVWSHCRTALIHEGLQNGRNFGTIDSSLFALCLDDNSPETSSEICKNMICGTNIVEKDSQVGTCMNRWYDKLAIIVCRNGKAGMNFEHTCTDGSVDIRMACDIYMGSISQPKEAVNGVSQSPTNSASASQKTPAGLKSTVTKPRKLCWDVNSEIQAALRLAETRLIDRIQRHQLETLNFSDYGKSFMTSMGFSPDAYFQMALHAAYYSVYGHVGNGFEPVQMRQYKHGRTDVVRTTTLEATEFAQSFCNREVDAAHTIETMRQAANKQVAQSKRCAAGGGHHRHLFVLHQLWKKRRALLQASGLDRLASDGHINGLQSQSEPTIFTDPGWSCLGTTTLMGSNVENPCLAYAGFGPPSDDGFTVCYFMRRDLIVMSVCSRNGQAKRFINAIEKTLVEIRTLLENAVGKA